MATAIPGQFSRMAAILAAIPERGPAAIISGICRACAPRGDADELPPALIAHLRNLWSEMKTISRAAMHVGNKTRN